MNYIRTMIITASFLIPWNMLNAQQMELLFQGGMGTYAMNDLRDLNTEVGETLPFDTRLTENFPMTMQLGFQFAGQVTPKYKLGVKYAYNSTGSRLTVSDYSGSYYFDNIVTGHSIGMVNGFLLKDWGVIQLNLETNAGVVSSRLNITENIHLYDTTATTTGSYNALGFFIEPRFEAAFQWRYLKTGVYLGYFLNPWGHLKNEDDQKMETKVSWSGLRFGIEIGIGSRSKSSQRSH